jgi:hypothetical protein
MMAPVVCILIQAVLYPRTRGHAAAGALVSKATLGEACVL